jgi:hypothetical protein
MLLAPFHVPERWEYDDDLTFFLSGMKVEQGGSSILTLRDRKVTRTTRRLAARRRIEL